MNAVSREAPVPYDFTLTTMVTAPACEIYDAWLDSFAHSEMTRAAADMSNIVGDEISAWNGNITGRNLALVPGKCIVQSWRSPLFSDDHEDSIVTLTFEETNSRATRVTLIHRNVPDGQTIYEHGGWQEHYFKPIKAYFAKRRSKSLGRMRKRGSRSAEHKPERKCGRRAS
jgi:activator of HSP90 ATPase